MTARTATCDAMHRREIAGERNGMSRHSDATVRRARQIHGRGYNLPEVREHLRDEGVDVDLRTLNAWISGINRGEA